MFESAYWRIAIVIRGSAKVLATSERDADCAGLPRAANTQRATLEAALKISQDALGIDCGDGSALTSDHWLEVTRTRERGDAGVTVLSRDRQPIRRHNNLNFPLTHFVAGINITATSRPKSTLA